MKKKQDNESGRFRDYNLGNARRENCFLFKYFPKKPKKAFFVLFKNLPEAQNIWQARVFFMIRESSGNNLFDVKIGRQTVQKFFGNPPPQPREKS